MSLKIFTRTLTSGIATSALLALAAPVWAADTGTVTGVISDAGGKPIAGAFVKLKNDQKRLTFMVISRDQGRFEAKDLPPGQYDLLAADQRCRLLLGGRGQEEQLRLGQRAAGRHHLPIQSQDRGMGRVPVA